MPIGNEATRFKKGIRPKGAGRPKGMLMVPKEIKKMNHKRFAEMIDQYGKLPLNELRARIRAGLDSSLDSMIMSLLYHACLKGDPNRANFLLDRMVGKVKDVMDITSSDKTLGQATDLKRLTDRELEILIKLHQKATPEDGQCSNDC